jgi:hypothetical protein
MYVFAEVNIADNRIFPPAQFANVASLVNIFSPILITGGAILFLVMIIRAGFDVLTAEGKPEKLQQAQKTFMYSIFGLLIVISSYLIVKLLGVILNIQNELKPFGF